MIGGIGGFTPSISLNNNSPLSQNSPLSGMLDQLKQLLQSLTSQLGQGVSGAGAESLGTPALDATSGTGAGGRLNSPLTAGLQDRLGATSGAGPAHADVFNAVSGAGAGGGLGAVSGGGAGGGTGAVSGGAGDLLAQAKDANYGALDASQKANLAMQEAAQKQSEAAAMISNIMKMKHDANMQIIGNMK